MLWAVIMAGGSGTRFWPESRQSLPKQFLRIFGKKSLLEETLYRLNPLIPAKRVIAITHASHAGLVAKTLRLPASQIVGEPTGRNTAPCAVLAAAMLYRKDPDAVLAILPSDHRITKPALFRKLLQAAYETARDTGMPVTFGMKPSFPHTGYGYLEWDREFQKRRGIRVMKLRKFHEKPSLERARSFLKKGCYLWNSGMFVWRADQVLAAAREHLPDIYHGAVKIAQAQGFKKALNRYYPSMTSISIDVGLMERLPGKILTLPADIGWHDLGGWRAFEELYAPDKAGNVTWGGPSILVESSGNIVKATRLVALVGVKDMVVVDAGDAILVCPKARSEDIRKVVEALKKSRFRRYL